MDEAKKTRGERVEDGTAHRDRPLFEVNQTPVFIYAALHLSQIFHLFSMKDSTFGT